MFRTGVRLGNPDWNLGRLCYSDLNLGGWVPCLNLGAPSSSRSDEDGPIARIRDPVFHNQTLDIADSLK